MVNQNLIGLYIIHICKYNIGIVLYGYAYVMEAKWITYQLKKQPKSGKSRNDEFKSCVRTEELTVLSDSADRG